MLSMMNGKNKVQTSLIAFARAPELSNLFEKLLLVIYKNEYYMPLDSFSTTFVDLVTII